MAANEASRSHPHISFDRAIERFTEALPPKQRAEFASTTLEDVYDAIQIIQEERGGDRKLRHMRRVQAFLEAMDEFRKVIQAFLNCTPFMGYVWVGR